MAIQDRYAGLVDYIVHIGGDHSMVYVQVRDGESFDSLLKRFRKAVTRERILSEVKKRRYFVKPSDKRNRALRKAISRERKRQSKVRRRMRRY
jgi:small subunit ribosomal protein S21